jgi:TusA-related sulfurtransferase
VTSAAVAIDAGELALGGGLLALIRPALQLLDPGGVLAVISSTPSLEHDLPGWCRLERHRYLGSAALEQGRARHLIQKGDGHLQRHERNDAGRIELASGRVTSASVLTVAPMPAQADPATGFAPRGAVVESGGPVYPFTLLQRDRVAPPDIAQLYDRAVSEQWSAATDIPWSKVGSLPVALESAVSQVMTFLAENELSALYVPSRFLSRIHPAYAETAMFLATQLNDEARHIDAFLKRARAGGQGLGVSSVTTSRSLAFLLELEDFTDAAFMLSVLGEGTFLDLLRFVEAHAPDEATLEVAKRARLDEARHVHFGLSHVRHALEADATLAARLEAVVRKRAAQLVDPGAPAALQDALTILAAKGTEPKAIATGHEAFRSLLAEMNEGRIRRLESAGFTPEQAARIAALHTPNFM